MNGGPDDGRKCYDERICRRAGERLGAARGNGALGAWNASLIITTANGANDTGSEAS